MWQRFGSVFVFMMLVFVPESWAETIILKSGQTLEARIIEKKADYIRVSIYGLEMTYYNDEIEKIEGDSSGVEKVDPQKTQNVLQKTQVEELIAACGLKRHLESIPDMAAAAVDQGLAANEKMSPEQKVSFKSIVIESFSPQTLQEVVFDQFMDAYDQARVSKVMDWLRSPLGKKIVGLEERMTAQAEIEAMSAYAAIVNENPPPEERMSLARRLDEVSRSTQMTVDTVAMLGWQVKEALETVAHMSDGPAVGNDSPSALKKEEFFSQIQSGLLPQLQQQNLVSILFTYRSLSDAELASYIDFLLTEDGQWYVQLVNRSIVDAMGKAGRDMGQRLAQTFVMKKEQTTPQM